jgi:hypothetical protein
MPDRLLVPPLLVAVAVLGLGCASAAGPPSEAAPAAAASSPAAVERPATEGASPAPESRTDRGRDAAEAEAGSDSAPKGPGQPLLKPLDQREIEFGARFQPLADEFGLLQYARASRTPTGNGLVFDYLPEGESLAAWSYRGTLRVIRVADTWEEGEAILPRYIEIFREGVKDGLRDIETWDFPEGDVTFVDYELHSGDRTHHNLGAVWQVLPGHIAIFEVHRADARFEDWQVERFREVAQRLGRADQPAAQ